MKLYNYLFFIAAFGMLASCDLVESPDDTANVNEGFITFPALTLAGDAFIIIAQGDSYEDPGFSASLGVDDITDQVTVTGEVDPNTVGFYVIRYSVETENELGNTQTVTRTREVMVRGDDIDNVDLAGQYQGAGFGSHSVTVTQIGRGYYNADKALASGNNISINFYHVGGDILAVADQPGPFGNMNTSTPGTGASLTATGFQWTIFIGCCGNFGPITFDRL